MKKKKERLHMVSILTASELSQNIACTHVDKQSSYIFIELYFFSWLGDFNTDNSTESKVNLHFKKTNFTFGIKCHVCMFSVFPSTLSHIIQGLAPSAYSVL